jgi:hypothetical protein
MDVSERRKPDSICTRVAADPLETRELKSSAQVFSGTFAFPPLKDISFPGVCIGCLSSQATNKLKVNVTRSMSGGRATFVGWLFGGIIGGLVGSALDAGRQVEQTRYYEIPICERCFVRLRKMEIFALKGILFAPWSVTNAFFKAEMKKDTVIVTFTNLDYAELFRKQNVGKGQIDARRLVVGSAASLSEQLGLLLDKLLPHEPEKKWFRSPDIPASELKNAIAIYARGVKEEDVLALADGTVLGSAKEGCLLTREGFYYNRTPDQYERHSANHRVWGGGVKWQEIQKAIAVGGFPYYRLRLIIAGGTEAEVHCSSFPGIRPALRQLIDQVVLFNLTNC